MQDSTEFEREAALSQGEATPPEDRTDFIFRPEGATAVAFKDEGEERGMVIGPVYFQVEGEGLVPAIPSEFDRPDWREARWFTKRDAIDMAAHFSLPFHEI